MERDLLYKSGGAVNLPEAPEWWGGSYPEYLVYWALLKLGMKGKFEYQSPRMGGSLQKGGAILDFFIPERNLAINVQSEFYLYTTSTQIARGELQRAQLESQGIRVVYVHEEHLMLDPVFYVREALEGREHPRF